MHSFPKNYCHHDKEHLDENISVEETTKVADIKDANNDLRYKVVLTEQIEPITSTRTYEVEVYNMFLYEEPLLIFNEADIKNYGDALRIYERNVKDYTALLKIEVKHVEDISIYADRIGYHEAQCCKTCDFSKCRKAKERDFVHEKVVYECHNPKNFEMFKTDKEEHESDNMTDNTPEHIYYPKYEKEMFEKIEGFRPHEFDDIYKHQRYRDPNFNDSYNFIDLHPEVDPGCVCKNYLKKTINNKKIPPCPPKRQIHHHEDRHEHECPDFWKH